MISLQACPKIGHPAAATFHFTIFQSTHMVKMSNSAMDQRPIQGDLYMPGNQPYVPCRVMLTNPCCYYYDNVATVVVYVSS